MCARSWVLVCVKVAFLQSETRAPQEVEAELPFVVDSWFIINRAVDMIFIIDIILQFFIMVASRCRRAQLACSWIGSWGWKGQNQKSTMTTTRCHTPRHKPRRTFKQTHHMLLDVDLRLRGE